ncbi:MAG: SDR family NAD(P)-dependent oxidoreductase [Planctomycetota bacterium]
MGVLDRLLDASIFFSFDASGFARHAAGFDPEDLALDLAGRRYLVTGANSGLGFATTQALLALGATVYLGCRSLERGRAALERLPPSDGTPELVELDVADLEGVRAFGTGWTTPLDGLIHNAGVLPDARELVDGNERTLATHVLGPWLLTELLRPVLERAPRRARVVWVSSGGMYTTGLSLDDVDWTERPYDGVKAYAQTKRMQVVLAELFAARWGSEGPAVHAMHPGWAATPGVERSLPGFYRRLAGRLRTPAQGADTIVWLAAADAPATCSGELWFDREVRSPYLLPWTRADRPTRDALWELCEARTRAAHDA